ncbi:MAG: extracellular solute-binding protein [Anaerolineales bacterium]|nr:extracellular solute-binding protein [Anaerolineales bacterium]
MKRISLLGLVVALVATMMFRVSGAAAQTQPPLTLWTKFNDQNPQNTQDKWLKSTLADYKAKTGNDVTNIFQPYDQINEKLNVAVLAGGSVPDVSYVDSQRLGFFAQNGTLTDLTEWVKGSTWYADLSPQAVEACTTPDGKILCVPTSAANHFMYYWKDYYPDGVPADTESFLKMAAEMKAAAPDKFPFTGKLAEKAAVERFYYGLILSHGEDIADEDGLAAWANEGTVKVVEFVREMYEKGYMAKESLAPAFDNEEPFKRGDAGAFVSGSYSYVYLTPLTAPDGTTFEGDITGDFDPKALSVGAAAEAGKLGYAPPFTAPGGIPASLILASAWGIPVGAKNVEAAKAFIDFQMTTANNVAFAASYGALPVLNSSLAAPEFQTEYWQAVADLQAEYGVGAPTLRDYDRGMTILADTIVKLITNPSLDIMSELEAAEDEYNAELE